MKRAWLGDMADRVGRRDGVDSDDDDGVRPSARAGKLKSAEAKLEKKPPPPPPSSALLAALPRDGVALPDADMLGRADEKADE